MKGRSKPELYLKGAFAQSERAVFPAYDQMICPMECSLCQSFEKAIIPSHSIRAHLILDWIQYQETRDDIDRAILG